MSAFGNLNSNNTGASGSTANTGLFAPKPATGGGLFGAPAAGTTGGAFSGFGSAPSTGATGTPTTTPSLFGSTTTTTAPAGPGLFGNKTPVPTSNPTGPGIATPPTSLFGSSAPASTAPATSTNPLFGGLNKPADTTTSNATKPAGTGSTPVSTTNPLAGGLFSQPPKIDAPATTTGSTTTSNLFGGGGLFGSKPPTPAPAAQTGSATASATLAPAKDFFAKPTEPKDGATTGMLSISCDLLHTHCLSATPAAAAAGSLFGAKPAESKDAATPASSLGGLFGKPAEKKDSTTPATAPSVTAGAPATASAGLGVSGAPPSTLKGKTIEEIVNKWSADLETHVREFNKFAGEVAVWDRALIENSNTLAALYSHVEAAEREQNDIDQSLAHVEQQQAELESTLAAYEKVAQEILGSQGGGMRVLDAGPADTERDKNYMLATDLHTQLDDLSGSLTQMIDSVNALSLPSTDSNTGDDPMAQIAQILSSHLDSLQWIDGAVRDVEGKMTEVEQRIKDNGHTLPSASQSLKGSRFGLNR
ncbi:hypothetical protein H0H92_004810 [Tricholoma furcatifolium]|nr:hypothetical protein H0H92_004810 [Tricholoma furcatifolium]